MALTVRMEGYKQARGRSNDVRNIELELETSV